MDSLRECGEETKYIPPSIKQEFKEDLPVVTETKDIKLEPVDNDVYNGSGLISCTKCESLDIHQHCEDNAPLIEVTGEIDDRKIICDTSEKNNNKGMYGLILCFYCLRY